MDNDLFDDSSADRLSAWLSDSRSPTSRADSQSAGGAPISPSIKSNYARTVSSSAGLVTRQGLRNPQVPNTNAGFYVSISGMVYPQGQQFQMAQPGLQVTQPVASFPQQDKSRYTMALMEYGQKNGFLPVYDPPRMLSQTPSSHRCSLKFRGIKTSGTASTVKAAKHEASYNACQLLGIKPK